MKNCILPRWQEPSPELLDYMHSRARTSGLGWKIALHLSNLQGIDLDQFPQVLPIQATRLTLENLTRSPCTGVEVLRSLSGSGLVTLAPNDNDALQRLATAYLQFATTTHTETHLVLLIPHDHFPGCTSTVSIQDLWWHPLLGDKWKRIVRQIEFLKQPACCVFSGASGPTYHTKSFALVTLATFMQPVPTAMTEWRDTVYSATSGPIIIVDCNASQSLNTRRALEDARLPGLLCWEGPLRSLGSQGQDRRVIYKGYFPASSSSLLDMKLRVNMLTRRNDLRGVLVGLQSTFSDPSSFLADLTHANVASAIMHLAEEVVFVSPRLALLHTAQEKSHWENALTELFEKDAIQSVERIRWRPSRHGGRTWVQPIALENQIRAAKTKAAGRRHCHASRPDPSLSSLIVLRGSLGADPAKKPCQVHGMCQRSDGSIIDTCAQHQCHSNTPMARTSGCVGQVYGLYSGRVTHS
jgi:hypothetical protein